VLVTLDIPPTGIVYRGNFMHEWEFMTEHTQVMLEWGRLQSRFPAYSDQRRALLDEHCPLIEPLRALVHDYVEPTNAEELWATGLGDE
jgi:hypothetical protein